MSTDTVLEQQTVPVAADLHWEGTAIPAWHAVRAAYLDRLATTLGAVSTSANLAAADRLIQQLTPLPQTALEHFLMTPRVSHRILWGPRSGTEADKALDEISTLAELENSHPAAAEPDRAGWVALGDAKVTAAGRIRQTTVPGLPPLDLTSTHARTIDLSGDTWTIDTPRPKPTPDDQRRMVDQLTAAAAIIDTAQGDLTAFVNLFTMVLVGQLDAHDRRFSSGTCWQYLGRSVMANFGPESISAEHLAEAVVHESIHGYLYMLEHEQPWVLDDGLYDPTPQITSPWSGRLLPVRPYLQACFVWFGLVNFWKHALNRGVSGTEAERLLHRALNGFRHDRLRAHLGTYQARVHPDILRVIDTMQDQVTNQHR